MMNTQGEKSIVALGQFVLFHLVFSHALET